MCNLKFSGSHSKKKETDEINFNSTVYLILHIQDTMILAFIYLSSMKDC